MIARGQGRVGEDAGVAHVLPGEHDVLGERGRSHRVADGQGELVGLEPRDVVTRVIGHELGGHVHLLQTEGVVQLARQPRVADVRDAVGAVGARIQREAHVLVLRVPEARLELGEVGRLVVARVVVHRHVRGVVVLGVEAVVVLERNEVAQVVALVGLLVLHAGVGVGLPAARCQGLERVGVAVVARVERVSGVRLVAHAAGERVLLALVDVGTAQQVEVGGRVRRVAVDGITRYLGRGVAVAVVGPQVHHVGGDELVFFERHGGRIGARAVIVLGAIRVGGVGAVGVGDDRRLARVGAPELQAAVAGGAGVGHHIVEALAVELSLAGDGAAAVVGHLVLAVATHHDGARGALGVAVARRIPLAGG